MQQITNIVGMIVGLAIVATIAAKPQVVSNFFNGLAGAVNAAQTA